MSETKRPDYVVKIKARDRKYAARVGSAWRTAAGNGINIRLDPGVCVSTPDGVDLTLWPADEEREERGGGERGAPQRRGGGGGYNDDGNPF